MKKKSLGIWVLIISTAFTSCTDRKAPANEHEHFVISDSLMNMIRLDTVATCPFVNTLTLTGKVAYNDEHVVKIFLMVSGNVSDIRIQVGDYVQKGQVLGVIRSSEMAGYANDMVAAKTNLINAKKNLDVSEEMFKTGLTSEQDLVNARSGYEQAEGQLKKASNVLSINGGNMESRFIIKAPVNGFIVDKQVTNNMAIRSDMATGLFTISDLKDVWVWANVYESNISRIHTGDSVQVSTLSYPGKVFQGKIDKVNNILDPANKVMRVKIVLPNKDYALKPEMFASVSVTSNENTKSTCVPSDALIFDNSEHFVLLYKSRADVTIKHVDVIDKYGDASFIKGDLQEGDKIIGTNTVLIYQSLNE